MKLHTLCCLLSVVQQQVLQVNSRPAQSRRQPLTISASSIINNVSTSTQLSSVQQSLHVFSPTDTDQKVKVVYPSVNSSVDTGVKQKRGQKNETRGQNRAAVLRAKTPTGNSLRERSNRKGHRNVKSPDSNRFPSNKPPFVNNKFLNQTTTAIKPRTNNASEDRNISNKSRADATRGVQVNTGKTKTSNWYRLQSLAKVSTPVENKDTLAEASNSSRKWSSAPERQSGADEVFINNGSKLNDAGKSNPLDQDKQPAQVSAFSSFTDMRRASLAQKDKRKKKKRGKKKSEAITYSSSKKKKKTGQNNLSKNKPETEEVKDATKKQRKHATGKKTGDKRKRKRKSKKGKARRKKGRKSRRRGNRVSKKEAKGRTVGKGKRKHSVKKKRGDSTKNTAEGAKSSHSPPADASQGHLSSHLHGELALLSIAPALAIACIHYVSCQPSKLSGQ